MILSMQDGEDSYVEKNHEEVQEDHCHIWHVTHHHSSPIEASFRAFAVAPDRDRLVDNLESNASTLQR